MLYGTAKGNHYGEIHIEKVKCLLILTTVKEFFIFLFSTVCLCVCACVCVYVHAFV